MVHPLEQPLPGLVDAPRVVLPILEESLDVARVDAVILLEVEALGGQPGVRTARYAGPEATYEDNVTKLLAELADSSDRSARFKTAVAFVTPEGFELTVEGVLEGNIAYERRGVGGFGYDPVFLVGDATLAEIDIAIAIKRKFAMFHLDRGRVLIKLNRRAEARAAFETSLKLEKAPAKRDRLRKLLSAPKFRLKGQGWYETDFKTGDKRNLAGEAGKTGKTDGTKSNDKSPDKGGDKPEKKPATKASNESKADAS